VIILLTREVVGMEKFKQGDKVQWTSQSKAYTTEKVGVIVAVVPEKSNPYDVLPEGFKCNSSCGWGMRKKHESYLIQVGRSKRLYWPYVHNLKAVKK
jgi:hypothetical protein